MPTLCVQVDFRRGPASADLPAIVKRIVCIAGFTQQRHAPTGIEAVWRQLRALHETPHNGCRVSIHEWREDWRGFTGHILRNGPRDVSRFDIRIIAYSWGAGHGAIQLARALAGEGIAIPRMALCDPVYYSRIAKWRAVWSPILGDPVVTVPYNVRRVDYIRQQTDFPRGHKVVAQIPSRPVIVSHGFVPGATHADLDNSPEFLQIARDAAQ